MTIDRLSIEPICAMGMPPDDMVRLASSLGVPMIGMAPNRITDNPHGFPEWDLRQDPGLVKATRAALAEEGVRVSQGEGFLIMPGMEIADSEALIDIMAELGTPQVNTVLMEQDRQRAIDQFTLLAEIANARSMSATIEFMPLMWPANPAETLAFLAECGAANGKLLLDAMHFYRCGARTENLAAIDPDMIGYVQICDVPLPEGGAAMDAESMQAYGQEARHERLCPGDGELPLADFVRALPDNLTIGIEVPMLAKAQAGVSPEDAIRPSVEAARALLG